VTLILLRIGIQRPLKDINVLTDSIYIPKGINIPSLDRKAKWEFQPLHEFKVYHFITDFVTLGCIQLRKFNQY